MTPELGANIGLRLPKLAAGVEEGLGHGGRVRRQGCDAHIVQQRHLALQPVLPHLRGP